MLTVDYFVLGNSVKNWGIVDYCDTCGQVATLRCPIDSGHACNSHHGPYPLRLHRYADYLESGSAATPIDPFTPVTVEQKVGGSTQKTSEFRVCDSCEKAAYDALLQRCGNSLARKHNGSLEEAFLHVVANDLQRLELLGTHQVLEILSVMGSPRPPWLKQDLVRSMAALLASRCRKAGRKPPAIQYDDVYEPDPRWYDKKRKKKTGRVASAWGWHYTAEYQDSDGFQRSAAILIRSDGSIRKLSSQAIAFRDIQWSSETGESTDPVYLDPNGVFTLLPKIGETVTALTA